MNDLPLALLKNGKEYSRIIPSAIHEPIRAGSLDDGQSCIVVIDEPVAARTGEAHALKFYNGVTVPAEVLSCHVGVEGWELAIRLRLEHGWQSGDSPDPREKEGG
jgi:hypothetical protein